MNLIEAFNALYRAASKEEQAEWDALTEVPKIEEKKPYSKGVLQLATQFKNTLPKNMWPTKGIAEKWLDTLDKCIRIDGYTYEQVREIIEVYRNDGFWKKNFVSPIKLRRRNNEDVRYIDYFWNKIIIDKNSRDDITEEEKAIERHNRQVLKKWEEKGYGN